MKKRKKRERERKKDSQKDGEGAAEAEMYVKVEGERCCLVERIRIERKSERASTDPEIA